MAYYQSQFTTATKVKSVSGTDIVINADGVFAATLTDGSWKATRNLRELEKWIVANQPQGSVDVRSRLPGQVSLSSYDNSDPMTIVGQGIEDGCRASRYSPCRPKWMVQRTGSGWGSRGHYYTSQDQVFYRPNPEADAEYEAIVDELHDAVKAANDKIKALQKKYVPMSAADINAALEASSAK